MADGATTRGGGAEDCARPVGEGAEKEDHMKDDNSKKPPQEQAASSRLTNPSRTGW